MFKQLKKNTNLFFRSDQVQIWPKIFAATVQAEL